MPIVERERTWVLRKLVQVFQPEQVCDLKQTARGNNLSTDLLSFLTVLSISDQEAAFRERRCVQTLREAFQMQVRGVHEDAHGG